MKHAPNYVRSSIVQHDEFSCSEFCQAKHGRSSPTAAVLDNVSEVLLVMGCWLRLSLEYRVLISILLLLRSQKKLATTPFPHSRQFSVLLTGPDFQRVYHFIGISVLYAPLQT